jgi:hypothetical protein
MLFMGGDVIDFVSQIGFALLFVAYEVLRRKNRTVLAIWGNGVIAIYRKGKFSQMIFDSQLVPHEREISETIKGFFFAVLVTFGVVGGFVGAVFSVKDPDSPLGVIVLVAIIASLIRTRFLGQRFSIPRSSRWLPAEKIYVTEKDMIR